MPAVVDTAAQDIAVNIEPRAVRFERREAPSRVGTIQLREPHVRRAAFVQCSERDPPAVAGDVISDHLPAGQNQTMAARRHVGRPELAGAFSRTRKPDRTLANQIKHRAAVPGQRL